VYATAVIMFLSFTVWLHHFFTMGNHPNVNIFFGITTMMIAIPTGVKVFDWLMTMYKGRITLSVPMYWTIGFFILFVVGGMTGVLMAIPPADFVVHNSVFLVAHFHNVLIPGALFGYFAGVNYWFPKAFGFKLNEKWGRLSFYGWTVGFIVAFLPLYVLGFMGMARRLSHYENPHWQSWLIVAWVGMAIIAFGIFAMLVQFLLSIINREKLRDETGDPWNGRTLEWMTSSPPPEYNFAVIPEVDSLDQFWKMKESKGGIPRTREFSDIAMPKNRPHGLIIGMLATVFGFAMIWYMWWLAIISLLGIIGCVIHIGFTDENEFIIPAAEVEETEKEYLEKLIKGSV
jgi:cytochrome o ubiquinol oxidase subunit I